MNEKELIHLAGANPKVFGELYDVFYPKIFGYIYRVTGDYALAGDITSETFLRAWIAIGSFKWKGIPISAWFFRIATNQLNQYFRKKRYTPRTMSDLGILDMAAWENRFAISGDDFTRRTDEATEFEAVRRLLQTLPAAYQQVIALRFFEELSIREIGQILQKKEGTVKSLLSRGLDKLKKRLDGTATKGRP